MEIFRLFSLLALNGAISFTCIADAVAQNSDSAPSEKSDISEALNFDNTTLRLLELQKEVIDPLQSQKKSDSAKTQNVWNWQKIKQEENASPTIVQYDEVTLAQGEVKFNDFPSGFSGSPSELYEIKKQFSLYEPSKTHLQAGKVYLRKDLVKKETWKPTID